MAQILTNIGVVPNDGTGDTLRGAFANTNNNFTELYGLAYTTSSRANSITIVANGGYRHANATYNIANIIFVVANAAFDKANSLDSQVQYALNQSNTTYDIANISFDVANVAYNKSNDAMDIATFGLGTAILAYDTANTAVAASAVYASDLANVAFSMANAAYIGSNLAYAAANGVTGAYETANLAYITANLAFYAANGIVDAYNTANLAYQTANTANTRPQAYDVGGFVTGVTQASERIFQFNVVRNFVIAADCAGSTGNTTNTAAATATFTIIKNTSNVGTMIFAIGANSANFNTSGSIVYMNVGDYLSVTAPTTPDTTLSDFSFTFKGVLA